MVLETGHLHIYTSVIYTQGWHRKPDNEEFEQASLFCYADHMEHFVQL